VNRYALAATGALVGALLAAASFVGATRSTSEPEPAVAPLDLQGYCHHRYGDDSTAIASPEPVRMRCSEVVNGVWGLEVVDLDAACRWQRGPDAHFVLEEVGVEAGSPVVEVRCRA
jgi:hypothetical protein